MLRQIDDERKVILLLRLRSSRVPLASSCPVFLNGHPELRIPDRCYKSVIPIAVNGDWRRNANEGCIKRDKVIRPVSSQLADYL
jgi:hypothetical protein